MDGNPSDTNISDTNIMDKYKLYVSLHTIIPLGMLHRPAIMRGSTRHGRAKRAGGHTS